MWKKPITLSIFFLNTGILECPSSFITSKISNKNVGKILYCDIFFSVDTIEKFILRNKISIYDHFNHLLIHSLLHINGYDHKKNLDFKKMKKEEIKILGLFGINNPYTI